MKVTIDYSKYKLVASWSNYPMTEYVLVRPDGSIKPAAERFKRDIPTWNLYWAIADRVDVDDAGLPVRLVQLPDPADKKILRLARRSFRFAPNSNPWTLAALMCRASPEEFMKQFWPAIATSLSLPHERGHVFSE